MTAICVVSEGNKSETTHFVFEATKKGKKKQSNHYVPTQFTTPWRFVPFFFCILFSTLFLESEFRDYLLTLARIL